MTEKREAKARNKEMTLRVEGSVPIARLQEMLRRDPELKLEIVASRIGLPAPRSTEVK